MKKLKIIMKKVINGYTMKIPKMFWGYEEFVASNKEELIKKVTEAIARLE